MAVAGPVFIAGATGYTGREVVREAAARGLETVAHVRPDSSRLADWRARFEARGARVDTTAWELPAMTATLEQLQPSLVFALLGTTQKRGRKGSGSSVDDTHEAVDYGLSILLLEAALACGSRPRFVYLSMLGADGRPMNNYMDVRKRVEAAVRGSGLAHVFVRPGFITGTDRDEFRPGERIAARVNDGLFKLLGALGAKQLRTRYVSMTGAELGAAMVEIAATTGEDEVIAEPSQLRAALERESK